MAQILPQRPHPLHFLLADFQWNMSGDSININNLCCNPAVLKKKKLLKIAFLGPISTKKGHYGPHPKWKIIFFGKNNNSRSVAPRNLFYQNIICFGWVVMNLFLSWVMLFVKKSVISSAKTAVYYIASSFHNIFHLVCMGALHDEATMCIS